MQSHACVYFVFLGFVGVIILVIFEVNPSKLADGGVNLLRFIYTAGRLSLADRGENPLYLLELSRKNSPSQLHQ